MNAINDGLSIIQGLLTFVKGIWEWLTTPLTDVLDNVPLLDWLVVALEWLEDNFNISFTPLGLFTTTTITIFILLKILNLVRG